MFLLLLNEQGYWLARNDLIEVGYIAPNWPVTLLRLNTLDDLESYLNTFVNDDIYDMVFEEW
jgi:hypothetical protein